MKWNIPLFVLLGLLITQPACSASFTYSADPIEAWVIDAETKKPLEGVVVTANWDLEEGTLGGNRSAGQLMVMETVTDKNGRFAFSAWGPKLALTSHLVNHDPQMLLFKSGYEYQSLANEPRANYNKSTKRYSEWNGKTIMLKQFRGTLAEYKGHFEDLNSALEHITTDDPKECYWKRIPKMIRAMNRERERERLIAQGANPHTLSSIDKELLMNDKYFTEKGGCGSPKTFFGDIQ